MRTVLLRVLPLLFMILLGVASGALRLFPSPPAAIGALNRFALYLAFPALILAGVASDALVLPGGFGFYLVLALVAAAQIALTLALTGALRSLRAGRGAIALTSLFGNTAYLGIPFAIAVLGEQATGLATLAAAIHIVINMTLGPLLLLRFGGGRSRSLGNLLGTVARQPLVWAPLAGLLLRAAPAAPRSLLLDLAAPLGASAGPVALFMLGLYLQQNGRRLRQAGREVAAACTLKLTAYPALTVLAVAALASVAPVTQLERQVLVLIAAVPVAITTFSLAEEFEIGREAVAASVVASTLLSLVTLPAWAAWLG